MRAWFDIHGLDINSRVDWDGISQAEQNIIQLIKQEVKKGIAYHNIYLAGFSQGGVVALYTGLRFKYQLAGVMGLSTYLPIHQNINFHPANQATPLFIAHGNQDNVVPYMFGQMTAENLKSQGYHVTWHHYNMAHQVCPEEMHDMIKWLN